LQQLFTPRAARIFIRDEHPTGASRYETAKGSSEDEKYFEFKNEPCVKRERLCLTMPICIVQLKEWS
jgi:hypothetical protein